MIRVDLRGDGVLLGLGLGKVRDDLRISERPSVPRLVPRAVEVGCEQVRLQDIGNRILRKVSSVSTNRSPTHRPPIVL